jgi:hypothetical protein
MEVINKLIDTNEAMVKQFDYDAGRNAGTSGTARDSNAKLSKRPSEVPATEGRRPSTLSIRQPLRVPRGSH